MEPGHHTRCRTDTIAKFRGVVRSLKSAATPGLYIHNPLVLREEARFDNSRRWLFDSISRARNGLTLSPLQLAGRKTAPADGKRVINVGFFDISLSRCAIHSTVPVLERRESG